MTKATILLGTPKAIIFLNASGNAASDEVVVNAISAGSLMAFRNCLTGIRATSITGRKTRRIKTASAPYNVRTSLPRLINTDKPL